MDKYATTHTTPQWKSVISSKDGVRRKVRRSARDRILANYPTTADLRRIEARVVESINRIDDVFRDTPDSAVVAPFCGFAADVPVRVLRPPLVSTVLPVTVATTSGESQPSAREGHTLVQFGNTNKLLLFGGTDGAKLFQDLWLLQPHHTRHHTQHATAADEQEEESLTHHGTTAPTLRWQVVPTTGAVPDARYGHSSCVYQDRWLLVYGGCGKKVSVAADDESEEEEGAEQDVLTNIPPPLQIQFLRPSVHILDTTSWQWQEVTSPAAYIPPLKDHTGVLCGNIYYIFGGTLQSNQRNNVIYAFDCERSQWLRTEHFNPQLYPSEHRPQLQAAAHQVPKPCSAHSCVLFNPSVSSEQKTTQSKPPFINTHLSTNISYKIPHPPHTLHSPPTHSRLVAAEHSNHNGSTKTCTAPYISDTAALIVFGGRLSKHQFSNHTWSYGINDNLWMSVSTNGILPEPRCSHSSCLHEDVMFVVGGYANVNNQRVLFNQVYILQLHTFTWISVRLPGPVRPLPRCNHSSVIMKTNKGWSCLLSYGGWAQICESSVSIDNWSVDDYSKDDPQHRAVHNTSSSSSSDASNQQQVQRNSSGDHLSPTPDDALLLTPQARTEESEDFTEEPKHDETSTADYSVVGDILITSLLPTTHNAPQSFFETPVFDVSLFILAKQYRKTSPSPRLRSSPHNQQHNAASTYSGRAATAVVGGQDDIHQQQQSRAAPLFPHYSACHPVYRMPHLGAHLQHKRPTTAPAAGSTTIPNTMYSQQQRTSLTMGGDDDINNTPHTHTHMPDDPPHRRRLFQAAATQDFHGVPPPSKMQLQQREAKPWFAPGSANCDIPKELDTLMDCSTVLRTQGELTTIVSRLTDTRTSDALRKSLEAKYVSPLRPITHHNDADKPTEYIQSGEIDETLSRLYYQQMQWKEQKEKRLEKKWLGSPLRENTISLSREEQENVAARLHNTYTKKQHCQW